MAKRYKVFIVSHTHWDREWYLPFQLYRMKLVKLIDKLLGILEGDPRFRSFTLDGQTIVVGDYLDIRPERQRDLKRFVKEGRILIGPWYILPDEFLVSGEATIRNLMLGHHIAEEFGDVMKVGYIPDPFGHISQMPQILRGFEIDACVLWRGLNDEGKPLPMEFYWQAPDGSKVLTVHLRIGYCNAANLPEKSEDALKRVKTLLRALAPSASTSNVVLMNGCDHLEPQPFLPTLIEALNREIKDAYLVQGNLMEYIQAVRDEASELPTITGEQRSHRYALLLPGVLSTRMYIKQENAKSQTLLERWAEPFSAFAWTLGKDYPKAFLWRAWRYLLENHPHDSICGCSVDQVHRENLTRFQWSQQIANEITDQSLKKVIEEINTGEKDATSFIVVFNPLGWTLTEAVQIGLKLPPEMGNFSIRDLEGKTVPHQVLSGTDGEAEILLLAEDVPACGYKTYGVYPSTEEPKFLTSLKADENTLENEFLKVEVKPDGTLTVTDKKTGKVYRNVNAFEDSGDAGDEYNYSPPPEDKVINSVNGTASTQLLEGGPVAATIKIAMQLCLPKGLSEDRKKRNGEETVCPITSFVRLCQKVPRVDIKTVVENTAEDHRLQVLVPTDLETDFSYADGPFDVVKRSVELPPMEMAKDILRIWEVLGRKPSPVEGKPAWWIEDPVPNHPSQTFIDVNDGNHGFTVIHKGLPEYEVKRTREGTIIALTLLRCVGWLSRPDLLTRRGNAGPMIPTPEAQCLGKHVFEYSLAPHQGIYVTSQTYKLAHQFNASLKALQTGKHGGSLPPILSFVSIEPDELVLSAIKKAEGENALILRLYNITDREIIGKVKFYKPIKEAVPVSLNENPMDSQPFKASSQGFLNLRVGPSKIVSLKVVL